MFYDHIIMCKSISNISKKFTIQDVLFDNNQLTTLDIKLFNGISENLENNSGLFKSMKYQYVASLIYSSKQTGIYRTVDDNLIEFAKCNGKLTVTKITINNTRYDVKYSEGNISICGNCIFIPSCNDPLIQLSIIDTWLSTIS